MTDLLAELRALAATAQIADHSSVERIRSEVAGKTRGRSKLAKPMRYARPSMKEVVSPGAGSGLWTGSQPIDSVMLNQPLRHTKTANRHVERTKESLHLSLFEDADLERWLKTIGRRNARLLELTRRQNLVENCPAEETAEELDKLRNLTRHVGS